MVAILLAIIICATNNRANSGTIISACNNVSHNISLNNISGAIISLNNIGHNNTATIIGCNNNSHNNVAIIKGPLWPMGPTPRAWP